MHTRSLPRALYVVTHIRSPAPSLRFGAQLHERNELIISGKCDTQQINRYIVKKTEDVPYSNGGLVLSNEQGMTQGVFLNISSEIYVTGAFHFSHLKELSKRGT